MSIELWVAFVIASGVVLVIPGPTILTVISYSVAHGRRANVPLVVALGDPTAMVASVFGVGALLSTSATVNATLYAAFAASARRLLAAPLAQQRFNLVGGLLLSAAGVWGLLAKRTA